MAKTKTPPLDRGLCEFCPTNTRAFLHPWEHAQDNPRSYPLPVPCCALCYSHFSHAMRHLDATRGGRDSPVPAAIEAQIPELILEMASRVLDDPDAYAQRGREHPGFVGDPDPDFEGTDRKSAAAGEKRGD